MLDPLISLIVAGLVGGLGYILLRPKRGLISRWQQAGQLTERVRREDALKHIHKYEMKGQQPTVESIAGVLNLSMNEAAKLLTRIEADNLLHIEDGAIQLTSMGRESALHIIRAHRLWERYLSEETGFSEADWHSQAERHEHVLSPEEADALAAQLGHPTHDPHGDPIPTSAGDVVAHGGQPLTVLPAGTRARIVHLEDEPEVVYAQLAAEGLRPGMMVQIVESSAQRVRFWANGDEHLLAPMVATNISVRPVPVEAEPVRPEGSLCLANLQPGASATVVRISPLCRGSERRRFMDLGILPGTVVKAEMRSSAGDPTAYQIRGALIALRRDQAKLIDVKNVASDAVNNLRNLA